MWKAPGCLWPTALRCYSQKFCSDEKYSRQSFMTQAGFRNCFRYLTIAITIASCVSKQDFPVGKYYDYDFELPLDDSVSLISNDDGYSLYDISYNSTGIFRLMRLILPE